MKKILIIVILLVSDVAISQHTFSIVAVDSLTSEIGSAGATCLFFKDAALDISDIVLGVGAIHTQAWWDPDNQAEAHDRLVAGDSPEEIISWLKDNDVGSYGGNIEDRQYGIVGLNGGHPLTAAFTGDNNEPQKGHRLGKDYSIQGNILISQDVLDDMEVAFLTTSGSLAERLMAVMQAAKRPGSDRRCLDEGWSSGSSFIRVAKPSDTNSSYGNLWLDISLHTDSGQFSGDPIDEMQKQFDAFLLSASTKNINGNSIDIYPNPSNGLFIIKSYDIPVLTLKVTDILGSVVSSSPFKERLNLLELDTGVYFIGFELGNNLLTTRRVIISK